ncbi:aspartyl-tRNA(Asn)/glutamyl-tRNA(Gln) amidotransferase subunit C [Pedobacter sp. UYEF25]
MILDENTIYKIAELARIEIADDKVEKLIPEMNKILSFMEKLNELDTKGVLPLVYMTDAENVWREDVVKQEITTAEGLKNAAKQNGTYFMVPKVIER